MSLPYDRSHCVAERIRYLRPATHFRMVVKNLECRIHNKKIRCLKFIYKNTRKVFML